MIRVILSWNWKNSMDRLIKARKVSLATVQAVKLSVFAALARVH
jgi:hypothetical protein